MQLGNHHKPHDLLLHRIANANAMALENFILQKAGFFFGDLGVGQNTETRRDSVKLLAMRFLVCSLNAPASFFLAKATAS